VGLRCVGWGNKMREQIYVFIKKPMWDSWEYNNYRDIKEAMMFVERSKQAYGKIKVKIVRLPL
jgi:hypothetical protein